MDVGVRGGGRQDACVHVHITATPLSYRAIRGNLTLAYCASRRVCAFRLPTRTFSEWVENPYRFLLSLSKSKSAMTSRS
jgi:hypothetical protein